MAYLPWDGDLEGEVVISGKFSLDPWVLSLLRDGITDPEADLRRSTYERPSDDELRNRLRREFGV